MKDIVLKPRGRTVRLRGQKLIALVSLGFARPGFGGVYRHPEVMFRTVEDDGSTAMCGPDVTMRFQTHALGSTDNIYDRRGPRGFMLVGSGEWNGCYGGDISGRFRYHADGKVLSRVIALVDRAREATRGPDSRFKGCDLLRLLIGLQRCGVEVRVINPQITERQRSAA